MYLEQSRDTSVCGHVEKLCTETNESTFFFLGLGFLTCLLDEIMEFISSGSGNNTMTNLLCKCYADKNNKIRKQF